MTRLKFSKTTKKSQIDDKNAEVEEIRKQLISCNKEITGIFFITIWIQSFECWQLIFR